MALKKSELYSSLWQSCDELRGGMDASQYKDYVLVLLFLKYISDKYAGKKYAPITIPAGASFSDMAALKGKASIGDDISKKFIAPLAKANPQLSHPPTRRALRQPAAAAHRRSRTTRRQGGEAPEKNGGGGMNFDQLVTLCNDTNRQKSGTLSRISE